MADDRDGFEAFVKESKRAADMIGNGHKVTEEQIRRDCEKIANKVDREQAEKRRKNGQ